MSEPLDYLIARMREEQPGICWTLIDNGESACIKDRGHDGGIHEAARRSKWEKDEHSGRWYIVDTAGKRLHGPYTEPYRG